MAPFTLIFLQIPHSVYRVLIKADKSTELELLSHLIHPKLDISMILSGLKWGLVNFMIKILTPLWPAYFEMAQTLESTAGNSYNTSVPLNPAQRKGKSDLSAAISLVKDV